MKLWSALRSVTTMIKCLLFELNRKTAKQALNRSKEELQQDDIVDQVIEPGPIVFSILS